MAIRAVQDGAVRKLYWTPVPDAIRYEIKGAPLAEASWSEQDGVRTKAWRAKPHEGEFASTGKTAAVVIGAGDIAIRALVKKPRDGNESFLPSWTDWEAAPAATPPAAPATPPPAPATPPPSTPTPPPADGGNTEDGE